MAFTNGFEALDPVLIQHPGDRAVLAKLENRKLLAKISSEFIDLLMRQNEVLIMGNGLHVTEKSMPDLYALYKECCDSLQVKNMPQLYLSEQPISNAFACGADKAFINITSGLLFRLKPAEIKYVLGHELGHIICGHSKYNTIIQWIISLGDSQIPGSGLLKVGLDMSVLPLLLLWGRRSEYSADRAGLLAAKNINATYSTFMKFCGLPYGYDDKVKPSAIIEQAREFQRTMSINFLDKVYGAKNQIYATHPRPIERAAELKEWYDEGFYDEIVNGSPANRQKLADMLRRDPKEVEFTFLIIKTIVNWAEQKFRIEREKLAPVIRKGVLQQETFKNTLAAHILRVEVSITPKGADDVIYELTVLYNNNGSAAQDTIVLPMPASRDYLSDNLAKEFIKNSNEKISYLIYSV